MIAEDEELVEEVREPVVEGLRLFSRGYRDNIPTSDVPEHHLQIHSELIVWGRWNATRYKRGSLGSVESLYVKMGTPPATAPLEEAAPPFCMAIERAILRMHWRQVRALRMLYVARFSPSSICSSLRIRPERYAAFMRIARAMVINLRRRARA